MNSGKNKGLVLRVDLDPTVNKLFQKLKQERNFRTNAEAIRFCITEVNERKEITIPQLLSMEIERLLNNTRVLEKYQIYDREEFVKRALENFILKIKRECGTLYTWSLRQKLNDDENTVAVALIELKPKSGLSGVTFEEIVKKTQLEPQIVQKILKDFNDRGLLYEYERNGKHYYYAPSPEDYET